jgi:hypothetical protein
MFYEMVFTVRLMNTLTVFDRTVTFVPSCSQPVSTNDNIATVRTTS